MKKISIIAVLAAAVLMGGCSKNESSGPDDSGYKSGEYDASEERGGEYAADAVGDYGDYGGDGMGEGSGAGSEPQEGNSQAGRITAAEWNDLDNWAFWGSLMTGQDFASHNAYWGFWTNNRVAVAVEDGQGLPLAGVKVSLLKSGNSVWSAVTDNLGRAECWIGLFQQEEQEDASALKLLVADQELEVKVTGWDCPNGVDVNKVVLDIASPAANKADIAFIVDATGSMGDEISFLQQDLMDILKKVGQLQSGVAFRTAALFYRDEGDDYVTRANNFTSSLQETVDFIAKQYADGGGDYPEAVHTALEKGLQDLSWNEEAKTRIAFLLLDAPAHHKDDVVASLQNSVRAYAAAGIKIIPISASGIDKGTEFMLRYFAVATNGTYVFITDDSGIGGEHIAASVGEYQVEQLNELIARLIKKYTD